MSSPGVTFQMLSNMTDLTTIEGSGSPTTDPLMTSSSSSNVSSSATTVLIATTNEATVNATPSVTTGEVTTELSESLTPTESTTIPSDATTNIIYTTAFAPTTKADQMNTMETTSSATIPGDGSNETTFELELWMIIVIIVAAVILAGIFIALIVRCHRNRKKKYAVKQKQKLDEMWSLGTGGAEVPMMNITAKSKAWKNSTESLDDKITTAVVMEETTVNVFAPSSKRSSRSGSARSRSSAGSVKSSNQSSTKASNFKAKKPLTKVEGPTINNVDVNKKSGDDEATSDANSVFTDPPHTPTSVRSGFSGGKSSFEALAPDDKKKTESSPAGSQDGKTSNDNQDDDLPPPPPPPPSD